MVLIFLELKKRCKILYRKLKSEQKNGLKKLSLLDQLKNVLNVNNGDIENANFIDFILHGMSFFWKVN